MPGEVPPERDRRAGHVDVGGLQRDLPQRPPHPSHLPWARDGAERPPFLPADQPDPVQHVLQAWRAVLVERGAEVRGGDVHRHRGQRRFGVRRDRPLRVPQVAGPGHRHPPVAPRLVARPRHGGQAILPLAGERPEQPARAERPPGALDEYLEPPPRQRRGVYKPRDSRPPVRRADQHHRKRPVVSGGPVVIAKQHDAIRHRHRDIAPDQVRHRPQRKAEHPVGRQAGDTRQPIHVQLTSSG